MRWQAAVKFALAALALVAAVQFWLARTPREIGQPEAAAKASAMLSAYVAHTGEPPSHFAAPQEVAYADGWQYSWRYRPCPDIAALQIFIHRDGRGDYGAPPECHPVRGLAVPPQTV